MFFKHRLEPVYQIVGLLTETRSIKFGKKNVLQTWDKAIKRFLVVTENRIKNKILISVPY